MKIFIALLIGLVCGIGAYAQTGSGTGNANVSKPVIVLPETARFQIVKLDYTDVIVKLDRYTGKTYVYDLGKRRWYPLDVRGGLPAGAIGATPKYQIYSEGEYSTFLLNSETGQSWVLYVRTWEPVTD